MLRVALVVGGWLLAATVQICAAAETESAPPPPAAALAFDRDPVQLAAGPFDVWWLSFSAGDQFLATSGGGSWEDDRPGQARIWDFAKSKVIASYPASRGIDTVALSPDGRRVALGSWSGDVWLREVGGAELMHETLNWFARAAFSPDGKLLVAVADHGQMRTWDGVSGKPLEEGQGGFRGATFPFQWLGFSPDGKYLVATGGKKNEPGDIKFAVWSVASRQQIYKMSADLDRIFAASISPDSQTLATSGEKSVILWDLATGVRRSETEDTGGWVHRVEFSPDGKLLASNSFGSSDVMLSDPSTAKIVGKLTGHQGMVRALAFTGDSQTLLTGGQDQTIHLWDVATRQPKGLLQGPRTAAGSNDTRIAITGVAYAPDGTVATASEDGQVNILGPAPGGLARSWLAHEDAAAAIAWSPDGKILATAGFDRLVKFWNPTTGALIRTLTGHAGWVVSLAFSHDGQTLASGSHDRSIRLWNVADGVEGHTLTGHTATVRSLAFSHDDKFLASASADQTARLWNANSGVELATLAGHHGAVRSVAFSSDDRLLASGGEDHTVKLWNVESHALHGTLTGHTDIVSAVAFVQQTLLSTGWDGTLRTWDADAMQLRTKITAGTGEVVAMAVAPDGRHLVSAGTDQSLTLWKSTVIEGQRSSPQGEYRASAWNVAFSPDGTTMAVPIAGFDGETDLYLYDMATMAEKYMVTFPDSVRSIAFAPAGNVIALGFARKRLLLVDAATGREVAELEPQPEHAPPGQRMRYTRVAFSPDGKWLAATWNEDVIRIYDVERRTLAKTLKGHKARVLSIAFSPDQKQLVSGSQDRSVIVWDLGTSERRYSLPPQPGYVGVGSVSFSPDGKTLATGSGKDIACLWNAETGSPLHTLDGHKGQVYEAIFSPDGKLLATGAEDGLVKLWDVATGKLLRTYDCQSGKIICVRFTPDGKSFVTSGSTAAAKLWWVLPPEAK